METKHLQIENIFRLTSKERQELSNRLNSISDAAMYRRTLALLELDSGDAPRTVAHRHHTSRQVLYKWMKRFKEEDDKDISLRLSDKQRTGRPKTVSGIIDPWIVEVIDTDPRDYGYPATTWTAHLLAEHIHKTHHLSISYHSVRLALDRLGFRWKRPRYTLVKKPPNWRHQKGGLNTGFLAIHGG